MTPHCPHFNPRPSVVNGVKCELHGNVSYRCCAIYCQDWPDTIDQNAFREWYLRSRAAMNVTVPTADVAAKQLAMGEPVTMPGRCGGCGQ